MVSSNIPFGNTRVYDRDFDRSEDAVRKYSLAAVHNYFFLKGMDTLREGGILAYITTSGVMDSPQNRSVREWLVNYANLVSTIRLPDNLFTDAGTEVGSDLIVLQKNTPKIGTDRKGAELYRDPYHIWRYPYQQQLCRSGPYRPYFRIYGQEHVRTTDHEFYP